MHAYPEATRENLLRLAQVCARTGLGRSAIYAKIQKGEFPSGIKLGTRAAGWIEREIDAWIDGRVRATRGGAA